MSKVWWKWTVLALAVICIGVSYFSYSTYTEERAVKKGILMQYVIQLESATERLHDAMEVMGSSEPFEHRLIRANENNTMALELIGNATYTGRHLNVPSSFANFHVSTIITQVIDELRKGELTEETKQELESYVQQASDLTSRLNGKELAEKDVSEIYESLEEVDEYMQKYETWGPFH